MKKRQGFTLIELAIVMMIAGLLLAAFLQYQTAELQKKRYEVTKQRLKEVRTALTYYSAQNGRLPCPDGPQGDTLYGKAAEKDKSPTELSFGGCPAEAVAPKGVSVVVMGHDAKFDDVSAQVWIGVLPQLELRLNGEQLLDGWGNKFTFAVSRKLTLKDGMRGNPLPLGVLSIRNEKGDSAIEPPDSGRFIVISHGPSGFGAYTAVGGRMPCEKKTLDAANCDDNGFFIDAPFSRAKGAHFFDDFVVHDDPDAGGTILDKLVVCNAKRGFYAPKEVGADQDGCKSLSNIWNGACLRSETVMDDGSFHTHPPLVLLPPAVAGPDGCSCGNGYRVIQAGIWDDSARKPQGKGPWTDAGSNRETITITRDGTGAVTGDTEPKAFSTRTGLYTCVQQ